MRRSILLPSLCLAIAMLAGCGNKGPLVMPPAKSATTTVTPAPAASSATPAVQQR